MAEEVSVRALELPFQYLRKKGVDLNAMLQGLALPPARFFEKSARLDWSEFAIVCRRIADAVGGRQNLGEIGHGWTSTAVWRPLKIVLRAFARLPGVYRWIAGSGQKSMFSNLTMTVEEDGDGLVFRIDHSTEYPPSEDYFLITKGVLEATPQLFGYPPAAVTMVRSGPSTSYRILLPPRQRWRDRLVHFARRLRLNPAVAAAEIERSYDLLEQKHRELQAAKRAVDELNLDLERRVETRTRELSEAKRDLEATVLQLNAAMEARDRLFANLNHEFRTPLSLILLPVDRMLGDPSLAPIHPKLRTMEHNARRLLQLVDGILEIAASREGRLELQLESVDVAALARTTADAYAPAAERLELTLHLDLPDSAIVVGDREALGRILDNLLGNAIKYTPAKGSVTARVRLLGGTLHLSVQDTGVGIAREDQERIFERFERASSPVAAGASSSGIGLALVRELARAHGGDVAVTSTVDQGSTFDVTLPCVPTETLLSHRRQPSSARRSLSAHDSGRLALESEGLSSVSTDTASALVASQLAPMLLIVEDNPDLRAQIGEVLAPTYQLLFAENGKKALEVLDSRPVDAIVSDLVMPGMNGLELVAELRKRPGTGLTPFLLLTAVQDRKTLVGALDAGADDFLVKPFSEAELLGRVRTQLRLRSLAQALAESKREAAVGLLLSSMAHELRNPVNVLVNGIEPLRESLEDAGLHDEGLSALISAVEDAGRRVAGLSEQLLAYRRAADEVDARIGVPALIDQSLALLQQSLQGVALEKRIDYAGPVCGSSHALSQVVVNLIENAIHATDGKGPVGIETRQESGEVVLDVWDAGPGVPQANRERIFEPFFSTKEPGKGTGLGLAISRQIAERHGGKLALAPSDHGARFRLTLPRPSP